jgi:uncharacterized protein (DUF1501 family)
MPRHTASPALLLSAGLRRRQVLALSWTALLGANGLAHAQQRSAESSGRLVLVFLRGAVDGLSMLVPYADPSYRQLRHDTAIPAPDGSAQSALALDKTFGLHPALAPLLASWQQGSLSFVPTSGLPQAIRSHFEAQHAWETGQPGLRRTADGWLNSWAARSSADTANTANTTDAADGAALALGVGETNPEILRGPAQVRLVARGRGALSSGALGREGPRQALMDLYASDPQLASAFTRGANSRLETAEMLQPNAAMARSETMAADNGAGSPQGLALDARHLATLMRNDPRLRVGFLSAGGWDTHANQGGVTGQLANGLGRLAVALIELQREFSRPDDVVVVASEFGRTCAENGTRGTDHGHGNAMLLMGQRINGGRWHGRWEGLAAGQLNEGRDLPVFHDFRAVLSLVLRTTQGASDTQLAALFPGNPYAGAALLAGDNRALAQLIRA